MKLKVEKICSNICLIKVAKMQLKNFQSEKNQKNKRKLKVAKFIESRKFPKKSLKIPKSRKNKRKSQIPKSRNNRKSRKIPKRRKNKTKVAKFPKSRKVSLGPKNH